MNRREFMNAAVAATTLGSASGQTTRPARPNILFILADDMGYGDLSCYGRPDYETPVLDQMAQEGIRFTDAYASAPVCTPTRCAFHTGRYPHRLPVGLQEPLGDGNMNLGLPAEHPTVASLLKKSGYETILIGKWHLGNIADFGPNRHGFDEFFGINGSSADYFTHNNTSGRFDLYENLNASDQPGYLTDLFTDRAIRFLQRERSQPFFLALQYNAPHWPWQGPEDLALAQDRAGQVGGTNEIYGEMVLSMDRGIGRIFEVLRRTGLDGNTLVVFTSDNGGERYSLNWPFQFRKMYLWEGGIRIPAIVRWPGVVPAGKTTNQALATIDWSATFLDVAGVQPDPAYPFDGASMIDVCTGARPAFDHPLFWRLRTKPQGAVRIGKWKYLRDAGEDHLFDIEADPGESNNLKDQQAATFERLLAAYKSWESTMLPL